MYQVDCEIWMPMRMKFIAELASNQSLVDVQPPRSMNGLVARMANETRKVAIQLVLFKRAG